MEITQRELARSMPRHDRVRQHTAARVNANIDARTWGELEPILASNDSHEIVRAIDNLDREWDVDRALMVNFATVGGASFLLGATKSKTMLWVFGSQMGFLLLHGLVGWCPPAAAFRRLGFRTRQEIEGARALLLARLRELEKKA
jgi:hypothetical protein